MAHRRTARPYGRHLRAQQRLHWYLFRCPIQRPIWDEGDDPCTLVEAELWEAGFAAFVPSHRDWRKKSRYSRRKTRTLIPLLPGYVFVGFETEALPMIALESLAKRGIIHGVLCVDGKPAHLRWNDIADWAKPSCDPLFGAPEEQQFMLTHKVFREDDMALIVEGAAQGQIVRIERILGDRARFRLGGKFWTETPLDMLERADAA